MKRSKAIELICLELSPYLDYDLSASALTAVAEKVLNSLEDNGLQPPEDICMRNCWEDE